MLGFDASSLMLMSASGSSAMMSPSMFRSTIVAEPAFLKRPRVPGGETIERAAREAALRRRDGDAAEPAMSSCRGVFEGHWRTLLYSQERL